MASEKKISFLAGAVLLISVLAAPSCKKEDVPPPANTTATWVPSGSANCLPAMSSEYQGTASRSSLGMSMTVLLWGDSNSDSQYRSLAMGAPGGTLGGSVRISGLTGGLFSGGTFSYTKTELSAAILALGSGASTANSFGKSLESYELKRCTGRSSNQGCGDELVVGAPGSGDDKGGLHWLYANAGTPDNPSWVYGGSFVPTGLSNRAGFGWAMSKLSVSGSGKLLLASAPGDNRVYLLSADSSTSTLSIVQSVSGPVGGNLGYALAVGDFDGDGNEDLVASSPNTYSVHFFRGSGSPTGPLNPVSFTDNTASSSAGDIFGASLAAGPMFGADIKRDGVLVGVPGHDVSAKTDVGQVVAYLITADSAAASGFKLSKRSALNPPGGGSSGDRFGSSVAIGNFAPLDLTNSTVSEYAKVQEVAVGSPGYVGGQGAVFVFPTNDKGFSSATPHVTLQQYSGVSAGALFGSSLLSSYLEDPVDQHITQDLVVGAPGWTGARGSVSVSRGAGNYSSSATDGKWSAKDSYGNSVEFTSSLDSSSNTLWLAFKDDFQMEFLCNGSVKGLHTVDSNRSGESYGLNWSASDAAWVYPANYFNVKASLSGSNLSLEWYDFKTSSECEGSKVSVTGNPFTLSKIGSCD